MEPFWWNSKWIAGLLAHSGGGACLSLANCTQKNTKWKKVVPLKTCTMYAVYESWVFDIILIQIVYFLIYNAHSPPSHHYHTLVSRSLSLVASFTRCQHNYMLEAFHNSKKNPRYTNIAIYSSAVWF